MINMHGGIFVILACVIGSYINIQAALVATFYVKPTGNDANNGSSWALAKQTIQDAVTWAMGQDLVLVTNVVKLSAFSPSGLPVSFSVASGSATISAYTTLRFSAVGDVSINASQAGNAVFDPAPDVTRTFLVYSTDPILLRTVALLLHPVRQSQRRNLGQYVR